MIPTSWREREREMDREGIVDEVGELLRDTHLFLILLGLGSFLQPSESASQWGPAFLSLSQHLLPPMASSYVRMPFSPAFSHMVGRWKGGMVLFTEEETEC